LHDLTKIPQRVGGYAGPTAQGAVSNLALLLGLEIERCEFGTILGGERMLKRPCFLADILAFLDLIGLLDNG
jgi:hypothetical protein